MGIWGHLRTSLGEGSGGSILGSILVILGPFLDPILGNLIKQSDLAFIWP